MPTQSDIEWTLELSQDNEVDVLVAYSWSPGHPGTSPSLTYPGDPPEGCEIEIISIKLLNSEQEFPRELTQEEELKLFDAIAEREYESQDSYEEDWRNEW